MLAQLLNLAVVLRVSFVPVHAIAALVAVHEVKLQNKGVKAAQVGRQAAPPCVGFATAIFKQHRGLACTGIYAHTFLKFFARRSDEIF